MAENRGKQFEKIFQQAFENIEGVTITRLHDQTTGFIGSKNPCDFIIYRNPYLFPIECKSVHGRFPLSNITDFQWKSLLEMSTIKGVIAGVVVWYIDHDVTIFYNIKALNVLRNSDVKSLSYIEDVYGVVIPGKKKKVFFEYDMEQFLNILEGTYGTQ